ncbi:MAG: TonB-dependent receptor [Ideonella sp.]|nr:TonB-dependent receptor [Ideonella sp.]
MTTLRPFVALAAALLTKAALAQEAPAPAATPASAPQQLERVEITGQRGDELEQRRQSTAAKIIVGRDEIERYGDTTLGEVLKRLPGVTMGGAPGRGGAIRMRGLGGGYTQILLDGERVPPGFAIDALDPEQVERIEILRAPTAETGARAIAGTINIIMREGYRKHVNDLKAGSAWENSQITPGFAWTLNDSADALTYNVSASGMVQRRESATDTATVNQRLADGVTTLAQDQSSASLEERQRLNLNARLQWRGAAGESLVLMPFAVLSNGNTQRASRLVQTVGTDPPPYASAEAETDGSFSLLRVNALWNKRLGETLRSELRAGLGTTRIANHTLTNQFGTPATEPDPRVIDDDSAVRDRSANLSGKLFALVDNEHSVVGGIETEGTWRAETRFTTENGVPQLAGYGEDFDAATSRIALYAQDEWNPTPQWSAHAGLRWEGLLTTGDPGDGSLVRNLSSVWAPIVHAVWKPDPASRSQVRASLTRSYRAPPLQNLIARPTFSLRYPVPGPNLPSSPDRVGNPDLLPELANGVDLAFEFYPKGGGILSASLFRRSIANLIRSVTTEQVVPWADVKRWVAQPRNIGNAVTQGLELEAKFRLSDVWADALPIDLRANASVFRSSVESVPGPDNRLDQQPPGTLNVGADYRLRSIPLTLGATVNWTPGYTTRLAADQTASVGAKTVVDANALWTFTPSVRLRLSAGNLAAADYGTGGSFETESLRETTETTTRTYVNWQLRLELKM